MSSFLAFEQVLEFAGIGEAESLAIPDPSPRAMLCRPLAFASIVLGKPALQIFAQTDVKTISWILQDVHLIDSAHVDEK